MKILSKVYYVSSLQGIRGGNGSLEAPFLTLHEINQRKLYPGDQVLLERGSVFEHQYLQIRDQGTEQSPILIGLWHRTGFSGSCERRLCIFLCFVI